MQWFKSGLYVFDLKKVNIKSNGNRQLDRKQIWMEKEGICKPSFILAYCSSKLGLKTFLCL